MSTRGTARDTLTLILEKTSSEEWCTPVQVAERSGLRGTDPKTGKPVYRVSPGSLRSTYLDLTNLGAVQRRVRSDSDKGLEYRRVKEWWLTHPNYVQLHREYVTARNRITGSNRRTALRAQFPDIAKLPARYALRGVCLLELYVRTKEGVSPSIANGLLKTNRCASTYKWLAEKGLAEHTQSHGPLKRRNYRPTFPKVEDAVDLFRNIVDNGRMFPEPGDPVQATFPLEKSSAPMPERVRKALTRMRKEKDIAMTKALVTDPDTVDYPFPLRSGVTAHLTLPADLTVQEGKRLAAFVTSLVVVGE